MYNSTSDPKERDEAIKIALEYYKAACFLMGANDSKFGLLKKNIENNMNVGQDEYPNTV